MKIIADTNLLLRAILEDDPQHGAEAQKLIGSATLVAIPVPVFCEMAWTMRRLYKRSANEIGDAIDALLQVDAVSTDRPAVEAGLDVLRRGGDFADGVMAWHGMALGGTVLATFDKAAIRILNGAGLSAAEPAELLAQN
jgi:predicted nucleic-acid-binding protein